MGPWTFAWICCSQLPCHTCKNGTHSTSFDSIWVGNQPAPYRGLSGPPGPKSQTSLENVSPGPQKVPKKSQGQSKNTLQSGLSKRCFWQNGHFAGVTPAIFVIFVDFRGPRSKIPCFGGQNAISVFSPIFVKTTCFRQGTKRPFSKTTVSTTLIQTLSGDSPETSRTVPETLL